ncbi:MAG: pyridoxal-phosphate dependent enzyme [Acidobacteria bacterium]|nr:pyridoxal-phosphate dependent enzyme [Acidobacteriota bacterium]
MISIERIEAAARAIDPVFLHSPQFWCEPLNVFLKIETMNPIRCFKGRGSDWLVRSRAETTPIVCASAGNFGQAMAYACRSRRIDLTVFAGVTANALKIERMRALGATVVLQGDDFDAAKLAARAHANESGARFLEDGLEPETAEGAGTMMLELARESIGTLLVPLGNGALLAGIGAAARALRPSMKIVAVQAAGAPAMAESLAQGRQIEHATMATIADGIGVRIPIPEMLATLPGLYDEILLVREESILRGMRLLHEHAGIVAEPSAAVGIAAMIENPDRFKSHRTGTIICGGNLTPQQMRDWLA